MLGEERKWKEFEEMLREEFLGLWEDIQVIEYEFSNDLYQDCSSKSMV